MRQKRRTPGRNAKTKECRELISAIRAAGGDVVLTSRGHLKVTGPDGIAIIGSAAPKRSRNAANTISTLRRCAGINVTVR